MKRIAKIFLGCLAGAALIFILVLVGINIYLQSAGVQARIGAATAQAFGSPVEVRRTLYTPWSGLILSGLSVADPLIPEAEMVQAAGFSVRFEFLPLLQRRFVISEINLSEPRLELHQTREGHWVLQPPPVAVAETAPEIVPPTTEVAPAPPTSADSTATRPTRPLRDRDRAPAYTVELRKFTVRDGSALLTDRRGRPILKISGIRIDGVVTDPGNLGGQIVIDEISIADRIHPRKLRASFERQGDKLAVTGIKSSLAEGAIRGEFYAVTPRRGDPEFDLRVRLDDVSVAELIEEAHGDSSGASGTLFGELHLKGNPTDDESITGAGNLDLNSGRLKPMDFIRQVGNILRIDELQMLDLERANVRYEVRDAQVWVDELYLETDNLIITAEGPIEFDGDMDLAARLLVNEKIQRELRGLLNDSFTPSENAGYKQLAFSIGGKASRPQTDLADRLLGRQVGRVLGGFLKGVFQAPKRDEEEDPKPAEPESRSGSTNAPRGARNASAPAEPGRI